MAVNIDFTSNDGVLLSKRDSDKFQQIYMEREAWLCLAEKASEIADEMRSDLPGEKYWNIFEIYNGLRLRASVSKYEGVKCFNLRIWKDSTPTKQGVSLGRVGFESILPLIRPDIELTLSFDVYADLISEAVNDLKKIDCYGCRNDCPSQKDHDVCLNSSHSVHAKYIGKGPLIEPTLFIERLAKLSREKGLIMRHPLQSFELCNGVYKKQLQREYLDRFEMDY